MKSIDQIREMLPAGCVLGTSDLRGALLAVLDHVDRLNGRTDIMRDVAEGNAEIVTKRSAPAYDESEVGSRQYRLVSPVHPEYVVRWFLDLHHYWFDGPLGSNAFTGMRDDAFKYLRGWIETGQLPPDKTLLEIHVARKFQEWLQDLWRLDIPLTPKPPLGVMPEKFWKEGRARDLSRAIHEYIAFGHLPGGNNSAEVVGTWIAELKTLWESM